MIKTIIAVATFSIFLIGGGAATVYKVNDLSKKADTHVTRGELAIHLKYGARQTEQIISELRGIREAAEANLRNELETLRSPHSGD